MAVLGTILAGEPLNVSKAGSVIFDLKLPKVWPITVLNDYQD